MTSPTWLQRRGFLAAAATTTLALLAACATRGRPFDATAVSSLQVGVSTLDDATRLLGQPHAVTAQLNGTRTAIWMYAESSILGDSLSDQVVVDFDPRGLMLRPVQRRHSRY